MKTVSVLAFAAGLFGFVAIANAETTTKCWPSSGNWDNAATKSCEIISSNNEKKRKHKCEEHESPKA